MNVVVQWLTILLHIFRYRVQISARIPVILTVVFLVFLSSLQASAGIVP
jgi:hypothetical protein